MSECIKCDCCGRIIDKDSIKWTESWSTVEITTHHNNGMGESVSKYHVCPKCRKEIMKIFGKE